MALEHVDLSEHVVRRSLADLARERIMQDIIQLRLHPGEIVQLKDLAQAYGMSRTPVREALAQMQHSGLISAIPYKGYRIRPLEKHDIEDVIFMRGLLEPAAAERAALEITEEELAELDELRPPKTDKLDLEFDRYSERFHTLIGEASRSRRLAEMISSVYRDLARLQYAGLSRSVPKEIVKAHDEIVDALRRRDPRAAHEAMKHHVLVVHAKALEEVRSEDAVAPAEKRTPTARRRPAAKASRG
jgi:GntR family transcriptional regulator, rspAB operon transcriptional repressor